MYIDTSNPNGDIYVKLNQIIDTLYPYANYPFDKPDREMPKDVKDRQYLDYPFFIYDMLYDIDIIFKYQLLESISKSNGTDKITNLEDLYRNFDIDFDKLNSSGHSELSVFYHENKKFIYKGITEYDFNFKNSVDIAVCIPFTDQYPRGWVEDIVFNAWQTEDYNEEKDFKLHTLIDRCGDDQLKYGIIKDIHQSMYSYIYNLYQNLTFEDLTVPDELKDVTKYITESLKERQLFYTSLNYEVGINKIFSPAQRDMDFFEMLDMYDNKKEEIDKEWEQKIKSELEER